MIIDVYSGSNPTLPPWCSAVIIKTTQGVSYVNPLWESFVSQCESRNIPYAFYHYLDDSGSFTDQINHFETVVNSIPTNPSFYMIDAEQNLNVLEYSLVNGKVPYLYASLANFGILAHFGYQFIIAYWTNSPSISLDQALKVCGSRCIGVQFTNNYNGYDAYQFTYNIFNNTQSKGTNMTFIDELNQSLTDNIAAGHAASGETNFVSVAQNDVGAIGLTNVGGIYTVGNIPFYGNLLNQYSDIGLSSNAVITLVGSGYQVKLPSGGIAYSSPNGISLVPVFKRVQWSTGSNSEGWVKLDTQGRVLNVVFISNFTTTSSVEVSSYPKYVVSYENGYPIISWAQAQISAKVEFDVALL